MADNSEEKKKTASTKRTKSKSSSKKKKNVKASSGKTTKSSSKKKTAKKKAVKKLSQSKSSKKSSAKKVKSSPPKKKSSTKKKKSSSQKTQKQIKDTDKAQIPVMTEDDPQVEAASPRKKKKSLNKKKKTKKSVPQKKSGDISSDTESKEIAEIDEDLDPDAFDRGDSPMTVVDHLDEFRSRILLSVGCILVFSIAAFVFSDYLLHFITQPFKETGLKLNIFGLTEGFIIKLKASFVIGLLLSVPVIIFQVWRFIMPAITKEDRRFSRISIISAIFLFYGGVAFVFFGILPFAIKMLLSFIEEDMISTIGANDYLSFIFLFSIAMGILFELPIVVLILTKMGLVTPQFLIRKRKYSIVIIWIIAAFITPQDILSQIMVAIPLMFLYELSILVSKTIVMRKKKRELEL